MATELCSPGPVSIRAPITTCLPGGIIISDPVGEGAINNFDDATTVNDGSNIIVITYDLELRDTVTADQAHTNTASLTNFAGQENGIDYTSVDPTDDAIVTTRNHDAAKSIVSTSEDHTTMISGIERVTIGEIIRYRVSVALPEGTFSDLQIGDVLPGGLTFIDDGTALVAFVSDSGSITSTTLAGAGLTAIGNETNVARSLPHGNFPTMQPPSAHPATTTTTRPDRTFISSSATS